MSKIEDREVSTPIDINNIIMRAQALDVLKQTLGALGPNGEHWVQGTARMNDKRCLAQTMFDIAGLQDEEIGSFWKYPVINLASLTILKTSPQLENRYIQRNSGQHYDVPCPMIVDWNDAKGTKFDDIKCALTKAIDELEMDRLQYELTLA